MECNIRRIILRKQSNKNANRAHKIKKHGNNLVIRNILGIKGTFVKDMYNYERVNLNISLETIGGFYVSRVRESSIAHDAGIRAGDVITAINGISINGLNDYLGVIHTPAETFSFDYIRGAETFHQEINND